jgi:hypothetical protein
MSDSSDDGKYPFQTPNQVCPNGADVEGIFGKDPVGLRSLKGFEAKSHAFGNPVDLSFRDNRIGSVELRGFGPDHQKSIHLNVNKALHGMLTAAFNEIAASGMSYHLRTNDAGGFLFRYTKNEDVEGAIPHRPEYGLYDGKTPLEEWQPPAGWADHCAERDRAANAFETEIPVFRHKTKKTENTKKKDLLSNHSWGTAIDLNYSTNGFSPKKRFDLPPVIVSILVKHGFYWGGYYHDYMHFEYLQPPPQAQSSFIFPSSHIAFPFGEPGKHESPIKYFFLNEHHGRGGYFPLGLYQNLHSGIHLNPLLAADPDAVEDADLPDDAAQLETSESEHGAASAEPEPAPTTAKSALTAIHAALPGYIVAARLVDPALYKDNELLRKNLEGQPLGFVLVRHELKPKSDSDASERWPLYSLYMHLSSPKWDAASDADKKADKQFEAAPWLEKFLRMEYGGVVVLDPEKIDEFGKTFWAKEKFDEKGTAAVPVRGKDDPVPRRDAEKADRILGFGKASPDAIAKAIERFKKGAVITFDRPVLPVATGEIIGFLDGAQAPAAGTDHSRRYLHWEIFAQPDQGLARLREKAADLGIQFDEPLKELCEDNFLEMPSLHDPGAQDEIGAFFKKKDPVLNPVITRARYAKKLVAAFQEGKEFVEGGTAPFHYPTTLKFANPYHFRPDKPEDGKVKVTYLSNGKPLDAASEASLEFGEHITLKLDVPAAADTVRLQSTLFRLDLAAPTVETVDNKNKKEDAEKARKSLSKARCALWKAATGRRWRNVVLEHINEWTAENLAKYIQTKVKAAYFDSTGEKDRDKLCKELEEKLAPLTWYAPPKAEDKPHGEQTALGDGSRKESLFGADDAFLPKDGHLESMHPATALWLLDLLIEEGKVVLHEAWEADNLIAEAPSDAPPFFTVIEPIGGTTLGAYVGLALIQHGYQFSSTCKDSGVIFTAYPQKQEPRVLALASYVEGAAVTKVRFPFWGKSEIKVEAQEKEKTGGRALSPKETGVTTLEVPCPVLAGTQFSLVRATGSKPSAHTWTGTLLAKEACPFALEGYLAFTYWKADAGKQPDFSQPGMPGSCLWPVLAEKSSDEVHERDGLKLKGDFIVGVAGKKGKAGSAKSTHVSADFVLQDFMNKKVAEADLSDFMLAQPLVQRLQVLRDLCKADRAAHKMALAFSVNRLKESGVSLTIGSTAVPAILERASSLPPSELFTLEANPDGKSLQLIYSPLPSTATLTFTTDLGPALQAIANAASSVSGEQVFARPIFIAPNGGHHVFNHLDDPPQIVEDQVVMATAADLRSACADECIQLDTEVVLPPAHTFGFGPITITMGRACLRTSVPLLGPARDWGHAKVQMTCTVDGKTLVGGTHEHDSVAEYWYLEKWSYPKVRRSHEPQEPVLVDHRWNKTFEFKVEATNTKGMANPPTPVTARFDATPKFLSLDVKLDGDEVAFTGCAQAIPTSSNLGIRCERLDSTQAWQVAGQVTRALAYARPSAESEHAWGCVSEDMSFVATAPRSAFGLGNYRFTWHAVSFSEELGEQLPDLSLKVPKLKDLTIASLTTPIFSGTALGGSAAADAAEEDPEDPRVESEVGDVPR